jgi:3-deoxy-D-manno-octulosonic-acid transferase
VQRRSALPLDAACCKPTCCWATRWAKCSPITPPATCAFVGGSLLPLGGQNLIEPAALGKPDLIGQHTFNFELVTEDALAAGGASASPMPTT